MGRFGIQGGREWWACECNDGQKSDILIQLPNGLSRGM